MSDEYTQDELDILADGTVSEILCMIELLPSGVSREELFANILSAYAVDTYDSADDAVSSLSGIGLSAMMLVMEIDKDGEAVWNQTH
jgi:hypothetical protein